MFSAKVSAQEQYKLIIECRQSGLSDQRWCLNHEIKPGTFYNWVKRLRQRGGYDIPAPAGRSCKEAPKQEVVSLEFNVSIPAHFDPLALATPDRRLRRNVIFIMKTPLLLLRLLYQRTGILIHRRHWHYQLWSYPSEKQAFVSQMKLIQSCLPRR